MQPAAHAPSRPELATFFASNHFQAEVFFDEPMRSHTSFRIGGPADVLVVPRSAGELGRIIARAKAEGYPIQVLGGGANLLVSDSGIRGLVVSTAGLDGLSLAEGQRLEAGAGLTVHALCQAAAGAAWSGIEFLSGLPGSVGGACFMNARCYDKEIADVAIDIDYLDGLSLEPRRLVLERQEWAYKATPFMPDSRLRGAIIVSARFQLQPGDPVAIQARMDELHADRVRKGHFDYPCAGSMFKNNRAFGRPSGQILDELGFRGRRIGDAMVSPKHANIFVNAGEARASDMCRLIEEAQQAAIHAFGFELEPEVVRLGF